MRPAEAADRGLTISATVKSVDWGRVRLSSGRCRSRSRRSRPWSLSRLGAMQPVAGGADGGHAAEVVDEVPRSIWPPRCYHGRQGPSIRLVATHQAADYHRSRRKTSTAASGCPRHRQTSLIRADRWLPDECVNELRHRVVERWWCRCHAAHGDRAASSCRLLVMPRCGLPSLLTSQEGLALSGRSRRWFRRSPLRLRAGWWFHEQGCVDFRRRCARVVTDSTESSGEGGRRFHQ